MKSSVVLLSVKVSRRDQVAARGMEMCCCSM